MIPHTYTCLSKRMASKNARIRVEAKVARDTNGELERDIADEARRKDVHRYWMGD